jgi:hypothetical protein
MNVTVAMCDFFVTLNSLKLNVEPNILSPFRNICTIPHKLQMLSPLASAQHLIIADSP